MLSCLAGVYVECERVVWTHSGCCASHAGAGIWDLCFSLDHLPLPVVSTLCVITEEPYHEQAQEDSQNPVTSKLTIALLLHSTPLLRMLYFKDAVVAVLRKHLQCRPWSQLLCCSVIKLHEHETFSKGWGAQCHTSHLRLVYKLVPAESCCSLHKHLRCHAVVTDGGIWLKPLESFKVYANL